MRGGAGLPRRCAAGLQRRRPHSETVTSCRLLNNASVQCFSEWVTFEISETVGVISVYLSSFKSLRVPRAKSPAPINKKLLGSGVWNCRLSISAPEGSSLESKVICPIVPSAVRLNVSTPMLLSVNVAITTLDGLNTVITPEPIVSQNPEVNCTSVAPVGKLMLKVPAKGGFGLRTGEVGMAPSLAMIGKPSTAPLNV